MTRLHRIIPLALAILAVATPAQAKLYDPNAISNAPGNVEDLRSPDMRDPATGYPWARIQVLRSADPSDPATGYTRAPVQDLRSPDPSDAAGPSAPSATHRGDAIDTTTWALLAFALVASGGLIFGISRARRTRVLA
jgi:hypothetical protein